MVVGSWDKTLFSPQGKKTLFRTPEVLFHFPQSVPLQTTALPSGDECPRVVIYFRFHLPWNEYRLSERQFRVVNASRPPEEFTALT